MSGSSDITDFTIFLIDDDPCMLKALVTLLQTEGHITKPYSSSAQFLNDHDPVYTGLRCARAIDAGIGLTANTGASRS